MTPAAVRISEAFKFIPPGNVDADFQYDPV
jgi:hypothetical protein